jgi:hypothetical protein
MIERFVSVCGQIGVIAITLASGWMIGPPADRLYAVDPVAVAKMSPSEK